MSENKKNGYVLVSAARNEEEYIEKTLQSVVSQTILPRKWVIVNDGSKDRTGDIVTRYKNKFSFIELVENSGDHNRNFGSKAKAVNIGYQKIRDLEFEFIGNLDVDVSFNPYYYENILLKFSQNKNLGIAGGNRYDLYKGKYYRVKCAPNSVGGPFQLFRRECFENIGGYKISKFGGIDAIAEIMARMQGWAVESYPQFIVYHNRATGTAMKNILHARIHEGEVDYILGYHPLFHLLRVFKRTFEYPILIGNFFRIFGFIHASSLGYPRPVSNDFVNYLRSEQLIRLRQIVRGQKVRIYGQKAKR